MRARTEVPALTAVDLGLDLVAKAATEVLIGIINDRGTVSVAGAPIPKVVPRASSVIGYSLNSN